MKDLYNILSKETLDDTWKITIGINPNNRIYEGHFPGKAIVPGAVLTQIIKDILESNLNKKLRLKEAASIKFIKMTFPEEAQKLELTLRIKQEEELKIKAEIQVNGAPQFKIMATYLAV